MSDEAREFTARTFGFSKGALHVGVQSVDGGKVVLITVHITPSMARLALNDLIKYVTDNYDVKIEEVLFG